MNEYYGNYCHPEPHDCKPEPCVPKLPYCKPEPCAPKLPYSPVPPFKDTPDCGYCIPPMPPCKPYVAGVSPEEQMCILTGKVNQMIDLFNKYQCDTYGAYEAIVNSALCNGAYYNEITTEEGYIAEASAPYKVIHIPFLDKAKQPIYLELGLAYNNTTNANVHEDVFSASQRTLADKLIPAYQSTNTWVGAVVWKGAPISNIGENPADYTVGVTDNGFIKVYEHLTNYAQLKQDHIRNAMQANSVLVMGGKMTPDKFFPDEKDQLLGRVGIGMNYDTKERFIVIVQGSDQAGCTTEMLANIFLKYNCTLAVEVANGMKTTALDKGQFVFTPPSTAGDEVPTVPEVNAFWYITKRRHYKNEYVKDVAELTQKYGQELWRTVSANISVDNIKELVAQFTKMLEKEIADREEGDNKLQEALDAETAAREEGDTTLNERITTEVQTLNTRIDTEVATLNQLISDTKTELQNNIDTLNEKVEQYHTELTNADIASVDILQDGTKDTYRLKRKDGTYVDIPMEVYNYELLVQKLDTLANLEPRLEQEIAERKAADTTLQENIDNVASDATEAENELREQLNEETQARIEADNAEKVARQEADTALGQRIDELQLNVGADYVKKAGDTMTGALTLPADPTENLQAATKQYVDSVTTAGLAAEAAEREKQDNLLNDAIAQEATTRGEADTALNNRVEAVEQAMTAFDNRVVVVGDTTLVSEGVKAITDGKMVLWVREGKDPIVFTAYDADEVSFSGYTTEQPAFVKHTFTNTGVAFNTGTETFLNNVVGEPSDINQAVSKGYVDDALQTFKTEVGTNYVKTDGSNAMTGDLNMGSNHITNVEAPANEGDAVNKQYVDTELGDTVTELQNQFEQAQYTKVLNMQNTVQDVVDAVKDYVVFIESGNDADRKYMQVYGVNSTDDTNYNINAIQLNNGVATFYTYTGVAATTIENCTLGDTINATIEDDKLKFYLGVAGTVPINITNVADPVANNDAANKPYVDTKSVKYFDFRSTFQDVLDFIDLATGGIALLFAGKFYAVTGAALNMGTGNIDITYSGKGKDGKYAFQNVVSGARESQLNLDGFEATTVTNNIITGVSNPENDYDAVNYNYLKQVAGLSTEGALKNSIDITDTLTVQEFNDFINIQRGSTQSTKKHPTISFKYTGAVPSLGTGILLNVNYNTETPRTIIQFKGLILDDDTNIVCCFKYEHENPQPTDLVKDYITITTLSNYESFKNRITLGTMFDTSVQVNDAYYDKGLHIELTVPVDKLITQISQDDIVMRINNMRLGGLIPVYNHSSASWCGALIARVVENDTNFVYSGKTISANTSIWLGTTVRML